MSGKVLVTQGVPLTLRLSKGGWNAFFSILPESMHPVATQRPQILPPRRGEPLGQTVLRPTRATSLHVSPR